MSKEQKEQRDLERRRVEAESRAANGEHLPRREREELGIGDWAG